VFLTAFVAVIDTADGRVRYANAGHPPAYVVGADKIISLEPTGPLVGLLAPGWHTAEAVIEPGDNLFRLRMEDRPRAVDIVTLPYPGFATDLLPMAIGLASVAEGASLITENIFDGRFMFVNEMVRLGADIRTDGHHAVVNGRERLSGAPVRATDIRAGAGLVVAGLCADGVTEVGDVHHIDRGYPDFVTDLAQLGVDVERAVVPEPDFDF
jgi:UDP-N-acetylglucosamine 1-carboxyvinyltransferase